MKKLKKQKITNLLNYQQFLKNNSLKKYQFNLKNILFENKILYNNLNLESYVIEFNNYKNIYLPFTLLKIAEISTIDIKYENVLLFNYNLTYNILYQFNKIMIKNILQNKNNVIKGRLLGGNRNNKKIFISILGFVFRIKPFNLNNFLNYKKKNNFIKKNKKRFYTNKINLKRLINCYKLKYLNFTINKSFRDKKQLSRISYINTIIENQKIKKKSVLSRKINVEK